MKGVCHGWSVWFLTSAASPPAAPPPAPEPVDEAGLAAEAARERRRRAQADTIATSWRGAGTGSQPSAGSGKRLIGE